MRAIITIVLLCAALTAPASVVQLTFTISLTVVKQGADTNKAGVLMTLPPAKYRFATKDILTALAEKEYDQGKYPSPTFPIGAKLVWQYDFDTKSGFFCVLDAVGALLCDVSNILTMTQDGNPAIYYGTDAKGGYSYYASIQYDDTLAGGETQLYFGGVVTETSSDALNTSTHQTTTTRNLKFTPVSGAGGAAPGGLTVTGSASAHGKYTH